MEQEKVKKYWFDIHHYPTTFYAFTGEIEYPHVKQIEPFCGTSSFMPVAKQEFSKSEKMDLESLVSQSEWRSSMYLFAAITLLSSWRMVRNRSNSTLV